MNSDSGQHFPQRTVPARGVHYVQGNPTIVFVTVCTKDRRPWLANEEIHNLLTHVWFDSRAWLVGRYVIMPDHLHLFAAPGDGDTSIEDWVTYWKSRFSKRHNDPKHRWQRAFWDRRLRGQKSYSEKWEYVRENPVRKGLVSRSEQWPFQGELNEFRW